MTSAPLLHIYGPEHEGDTAYIVGTRDAIHRLRSVMEALIYRCEDGYQGGNFQTGDGEGSPVIVLAVDEAAMRTRLAVPYTDKYSAEQRPDALRPGQVLKAMREGTWKI